MKKIPIIIIYMLIIILINNGLLSCGFKPRSSNDIPPRFRVLYLDSSNSYDPLVIQLSRTLRAFNVHLTKTRETAPVTLQINYIRWKIVIPAILYSSNATTYFYTLSVGLILKTQDGQPIKKLKNLTITCSLLQNSNQMYTPNATNLMKLEMTHMMIKLIYNYLTTAMKY